MAAKDFTAEELRSLVDYDSATGIFVRKVALSRRSRVGAVLGCKTVRGYMQANIGGTVRPLHRLAWLYVYGRWPDHHIDHINGDRTDNRIANLRDVPNGINRQNMRKSISGARVGLLGVCKTRGGKFLAQISAKGRHYHLGHFVTAEEAHAAYVIKKRELHEGCTL